MNLIQGTVQEFLDQDNAFHVSKISRLWTLLDIFSLYMGEN